MRQTTYAWRNKAGGHSVNVMLEHYERVHQSDHDQIEQVCSRINQEKVEATEKTPLNSASLPAQKESFTAENTAPIYSQKASLYTTVSGVNERHGAETPTVSASAQPLDTVAFSCKKWQEEAHSVNLQNTHHGEDRIRTCGTHTSSRI